MTADLDFLSINTIRTLAADVVQKANSGHPGAPMGCAPMAHVLFSKHLKANPKDSKWINRDRFVLSNGHGCALQYILLHLMGYQCSMDDLKSFRQLHSKTPGHPEANHGLEGIEVTTGPLGQGISAAVGLAMAEAHLAARFNKPDFKLFDNYTYVVTGDGCLQEGVQAEAVSLAGHLKLGKLIVLYDDNNITIDGETDVSFTEDVIKRFESYGWHTLTVKDGDADLNAIDKAIEDAKKVTDKPSLIKIKTTIGFGSLKQGEEKVHGAPLGADDIAQVKQKFGFPADKQFYVPAEVYEYYKQFGEKGAQSQNSWNALFQKYKNAYPELYEELERRVAGKLPENFAQSLPRYTPSDAPVATRKLSEAVLNKIADLIPELVGGSADLTGSNLTRWKTASDFQADGSHHGSYAGRYIRFGVREHGMAAICNGMSAYGGFVPFGATFFNFITYAWGAVRLSALSKHQVFYIMTHDSIGLGEDGPTHQPIEALAACRALPNLFTFRPADGNEVSGAYLEALHRKQSPSVIVLTRQNLPHLAGSSVESVARGGYILQEATGNKADVILVATGSEVSLAVEATKELAKSNVKARVVSMPCTELFDIQSQAYRETVFPQGIPVLSIEAMSTLGWSKYAHASIGLDTFGLSAPAKEIFKYFGLVADKVAEKAQKVVAHYKNVAPEWKVKSIF